MDLTERIGQAAKQRNIFERGLGMQVLGLASDEDRVVGAAYSEPGFYIWNVDHAGPRLTDLQVVSNERSAAKSHSPLWRECPEIHSTPRAQDAHLDGDLLFYVQNGGTELGEANLSTHETASNPGFEERVESFTILSDGRIATLENARETVLGLYRRGTSGLEAIDRTPVRDLVGEQADYLYGITEWEGHLLMVTDRRSSLPGGIYAIQVDSDTVADRLRLLSNTAGIHGNGLARLPQGFLISEYTFDRTRPDLGGPPQIKYLPDTTPD